jgi:peptide chain release factor 3
MSQASYQTRRTFCIVSHPDAGKTTLTEKLLLFGGAIQIAGTVKARKASRHATSDWMAIEKERGISVTSSVMQFSYAGKHLNLLDTPGHKDFSEDTYRVLTAVDAALMVIDGAKGIEERTKKLMEICSSRKIPVVTFINKLDRECRSPIDLLDEIESTLQIKAAPMTWPLRSGKSFRGVYHLTQKIYSPFELDQERPQEVLTQGLSDSRWSSWVEPDMLEELKEQVELVQGVYDPFDLNSFLNGNQTPVFFGSAINNFGIEMLLKSFCEISPAPQPRFAQERMVEPGEKDFSGFVFKIQANMDSKHRDRIAFLRVCSGRFEKGMEAYHGRLKKKFRVGSTFQFMADERVQVEEAVAGDIIGLYDRGDFKIGDSISTREPLQFLGIPHFAPEMFKRVVLKSPLKSKQLRLGLQQLSEEGASQVFFPQNSNDIIIGVVGQLQFEVIQHRLQHEYGAESVYDNCAYKIARWVAAREEHQASFAKVLDALAQSYDTLLCKDAEDRWAILCSSEYALAKAQERYPEVKFIKTAEAGLATAA